MLALRGQTRPPDTIIVVNNNSTDGTRAWLDNQQDMRVIHQENHGAGSAIACALAERGVQSMHDIDAEDGRAEALVDKLRAAFPECKVAAATQMPDEADMVVNASPVGMQPDDGMPGAIGALPEGTLVGDTVIADAPTALIRHAARSGCSFVDGRDMHAGQVDAILRFLAPASGAFNG